MLSYFIRHTEGLAVQDQDIEQLWKENKVAIHFPGLMAQENNSFEPEDYKDTNENNRGAYAAMKVFKELNESGGYIWSEYRTHKSFVKIGIIRQRSADPFDAKYVQYEKGAFHRDKGTPTKLKSLQMECCRPIDQKKNNYWYFILQRPPFLTISRWKVIGNCLEQLVKDDKVTIDKFENLHYKIQEVVCSEFLRSGKLERENVPKLKHLLMQVGGPLADIDVGGYSDDGKMILAQVTNYEEDHPNSERKRKALIDCPGAHQSHLILFCKCDKVDRHGDILYVPTNYVFQWLKENTEYYGKLFPSFAKQTESTGQQSTSYNV